MRLHSLPFMHNAIHSLGKDYDLRVPIRFQRLAWVGLVYLIGVTLTSYVFTAQAYLWFLLPLGALLFLPSLLVVAITYFTRHVRLRIRDQIVGAVLWRGDEQVLDIGTGSGITLIGCAQRLTTGKAIGIDIYDPNAGGGTPAIFWKNVKTKGVADRVDLQNVNACQMPFADASFDVIVSTLAFHHIHSSSATAGRQEAAREILRVLRPGGTVLIFDVTHALNEAETVLRTAGINDIQRSGHLFSLLQARRATEPQPV